jgi:hypothetical protein
MNALRLFALALLIPLGFLQAQTFETAWIPSKPEIATYRSTSPQGDGLYQVVVSKTDSIIEVYINMISPGFTKTVHGRMTSAMRPLASSSFIAVGGQIIIETSCQYTGDKIHLSSVIKPYNQTVLFDSAAAGPIVDFSQVPLLGRIISLKPGTRRSFVSINPQSNALVTMTTEVVGTAVVDSIECAKVDMNNFEGLSTYWIEKASPHRAIRIEQPGTHRVTELLR